MKWAHVINWWIYIKRLYLCRCDEYAAVWVSMQLFTTEKFCDGDDNDNGSIYKTPNARCHPIGWMADAISLHILVYSVLLELYFRWYWHTPSHSKDIDRILSIYWGGLCHQCPRKYWPEIEIACYCNNEGGRYWNGILQVWHGQKLTEQYSTCSDNAMAIKMLELTVVLCEIAKLIQVMPLGGSSYDTSYFAIHLTNKISIM